MFLFSVCLCALPELRNYWMVGRADQQRVQKIAASAQARQQAVSDLRGKFYASTTENSMKSRVRMYEKILGGAGKDAYPVDLGKIEIMAAILAKANYRSVNVYIDAIIATAEMQGTTFTMAEKGNIRRIKRACLRGIGPDEGAKPLPLGAILKVRRMMQKGTGQEISRSTAYLIGWWYMMRGIELVNLKMDQVRIVNDRATIRFEVTKNDQKGQGCERMQACICVDDADVCGCPVHTLIQLISMRKKEGARGNDLVFIDERGEQWDQGNLREALRNDLKKAGVDEAELYSLHSFRVGGTQGHLEAGIPKQSMKVFGRWKSDVIDRYARESYISDSANYSRRVTRMQFGENSERCLANGQNKELEGAGGGRDVGIEKLSGSWGRNVTGSSEKVPESDKGLQLRKGSRWLRDPQSGSSWLINF